jgi:hypothetical protein
LILLFISYFINAQGLIKKIIVDSENNEPISNAHIYIDNDVKSGTISNEDGLIVIQAAQKENSLIISHISYKLKTVTIAKHLSDTIKLEKKITLLGDVNLTDLSGHTIMKRAVAYLKSNHYVEPVMYNVYVREIAYENDKSELHVLAEYLFNLYQNKNSNSKFRFLKVRAKPFSNTGKKYFKDMRVITPISIFTDNLFAFKKDILKEKKIEKYNIKVLGETEYDGESYYKLRCTRKRSNDSLIYLINKETYAIAKQIDLISNKEIGFKEVEGKWYLSYTRRCYKSTLFEKWKKDSDTNREYEVIYNIGKLEFYEPKQFKTTVNIIAEPIKEHLGNWSDSFWEDYDFIPLPNWIRKEIDKENSR